jgi:hypothetical protein
MTHSSGIILLTTEENKEAITRFQDDRLQVILRFSIVIMRSTWLAQNLTAD